MQLGIEVRTTVASGPVASGAGPVVGAVLDRAGFERVRFLAVLGAAAVNSTVVLKAQGGNDPLGADMVDIVNTVVVAGVATPVVLATPAVLAAAAVAPATGTVIDGQLLSLDVIKPANKRYVRPVLLFAGGNVAVTCVLAESYDGRKTPTAAGGAVAVAAGQG